VTPTPGPRIDLLDLGAAISGEERQTQQTVRQFVQRRVIPHIADWYEAGRFPRELVAELGELGLLGMQLEGYGCAHLGPTAHGLACMELEAGDSALRSFVSVQGSLVMYPILRFGSEEQRQRWLPGLARGEEVGCFGLTEPDAGSDPGSMRTSARRQGGDWVLNGTKLWITNGSIADVALIWARTEDGIRGFLVPTSSPGFESRDIAHKWSMRASVTSQLSLVDVRLPESSALPEARGLRAALACLDEARFGIAFGALGAARSCLECALAHALQRAQFGRPIAAFQLTQKKLVDMNLALTQATLLALQLGRLKSTGGLESAQISLGKLASVRAALFVAQSARSILGASGVTLEPGVMRHLGNLESVLTYEGTDEVHTLTVGQAMTGLGAFR